MKSGTVIASAVIGSIVGAAIGFVVASIFIVFFSTTPAPAATIIRCERVCERVPAPPPLVDPNSKVGRNIARRDNMEISR